MQAGLTKSRGLALVIVLFILVIMTVSVAWLSEEILLSLRRTENNRDSEQAWQMLVGSEAWALSVLERDLRDSQSDYLGEAWNNLGKGVVVENGSITTRVIDMQGRLNLNNMIVETGPDTPRAANTPNPRIWTQAFRRLLILLEMDPNLSDAVLDWLDPDQNVRGSLGAEDSDYLSLKPPYRAANRAFSDVSELLWVRGFDIKAVKKLAPYITALPASDLRININTAPAGVLRILTRNPISKDRAEQLQLIVLKPGSGKPSANRPGNTPGKPAGGGGLTVEEFLQSDIMAGEADIAAPLIGNNSSYFIIQSTTQYGRATMKINSLVERKGGKVAIIWRRPVL